MPSLSWIGKEAVLNHHKDVPFRFIERKDKKFITASDNLLIEGDNLEALKSLLPFYKGKIKCIYIDPPYNTGKEDWIYNDNVSSPEIKKWLGKVVKSDDLSRHDKWLCMVYPRLKLLRDLLNEYGVIFVSIDDNEVINLRHVLNDIFGENNFIAQLTAIMNLKGNNDQFGFAGTHQYVLVYSKNKSKARLRELHIATEEEHKGWDEDEYGSFKQGANLKSTGINSPREKRPNLFFPLFVSRNTVSVKRLSKKDIKIIPMTDGKEMTWRWSKSKIEKEPHNIIVKKNKNKISIYKKQRPKLGDLPTKKPKTIFYKPEYSSGNGTEQLRKLFGSKVFPNPKPLALIKDLITIGSDTDDIILDSFAGSGTTAQAIMELNQENGDSRKFILIEMESKIAKSITAKRINIVSKSYTPNPLPPPPKEFRCSLKSIT